MTWRVRLTDPEGRDHLFVQRNTQCSNTILLVYMYNGGADTKLVEISFLEMQTGRFVTTRFDTPKEVTSRYRCIVRIECS